VLSSLAPARRRLVLALLGIGVVAVAAGGLALVAGRSSDAPVAAVDQSVPGPVLLVPGYGGSTDSLTVLADRLRAAGRDATVVDLPDGGTGDLAVQARTLADAADAARSRTGAGSVDVVGYSAGGVVARIWAKDLGGAAEARRIVTLGSPHHGTQLAGLAAGLVPGQCPTACRQLAPDSFVLSALNSGDETPDGPQWVSFWTTRDQVVTPPRSASLDGARDVPVQDVCPSATVDHGNLPRDPVVGALVLAELGSGPTVTPGSGSCATYGGPRS
jgi:triacylglycerol lipase